MAITFDTKDQTPIATSNPQAKSYTCGANAKLLVVTLIYANGVRTGAPTFNGVALTQAHETRYHTSSPEARAEAWYLQYPPVSSAYTVSVPNPNGLSLEVCISSYNAPVGIVHHTDDGNNAAAANPSVTLVTTGPCLMVAVVASGHDAWAPSAQGGTALYNTDNGSWGGGHQYFIQDAAGSKAMNWTQAGDDYGAVAVAFQEIPVGLSGAKAVSFSALGAPNLSMVKAVEFLAIGSMVQGVSVVKAVEYLALIDAEPEPPVGGFKPHLTRSTLTIQPGVV